MGDHSNSVSDDCSEEKLPGEWLSCCVGCVCVCVCVCVLGRGLGCKAKPLAGGIEMESVCCK